MPLSDHEQRLLDEIEQALYAEDPKFAASVRSARTRSRTRQLFILSIFGVIAGLGLVLVGLIANIIVLSVVGFVLVVGACAFAAQTIRNRSNRSGTPETGGAAPPRNAKSGGLRSRMEDRLRKRFDEN